MKIQKPKIVENGCIYLDLSDDVNYEEVIQNLSSNLNKTLEEFFEKGSLPLDKEFVESKNIDGENINGEQAIERLCV